MAERLFEEEKEVILKKTTELAALGHEIAGWSRQVYPPYPHPSTQRIRFERRDEKERERRGQDTPKLVASQSVPIRASQHNSSLKRQTLVGFCFVYLFL